PAFLFLPPRRRSHERKSPRLRNDYLRTLVAVQQSSDRPLYVVPHTVVDRGIGGSRGGLTSLLFGDKRRPGGLRRLAMLLSTYRHATVRVGDPIAIQDLIAEAAQTDAQQLARKLGHEIHRRIADEERVIAGPEMPSLATVSRRVLRDARLQLVIAEQAGTSGRRKNALERRALSLLKEIAARYDTRFVQGLDRLFRWVFKRIYDGIIVDEVGLASVVEAARRGPLIFCPSHRSHIDYLVLSYVLWQHGIAPPHIAAGANLAFFPLGPIFRRAGAFFLRRSFRDDPLYAAVFRAYVTDLVKVGVSIEFFLEGTRSRTGKLLRPKLGLLGMLVDAWRQGERSDLQFVPVSIDYERVIEAGAYERELSGADKHPENIGGLLRTTRVLRSRYGRVHLQFGTPVSLAGAAAARHLPQSADTEHDEAWRVEVERLGHRILHDVARVASVTPTAVVATAMLAHRRRGITEDALLTRCLEMIDFLDEQAARLSSSLEEPDNRREVVREAAHNLAQDGLIVADHAGRRDSDPVYRVPENKRMLLDFHKNAVMNIFAPLSLIARAIVHQAPTTASYGTALQGSRFLSRLFKHEFVYRADADFATHFDEAIGSLAVRGYLDVHEDGHLELRNTEALTLLASLVDSFVEAYWMVATTLRDLRSFPLWDRELIARAGEHAQRAFLVGDIGCAEAASTTLIGSAVGWMVDSGVLQARTEGRRKNLRLSERYADEQLEKLIGDIHAFVVVRH
ncbi:MAG: 1-acyl-sn-glycerol-3-phosphate acyltransferase, partial [Myxococcota bacterium]